MGSKVMFKAIGNAVMLLICLSGIGMALHTEPALAEKPGASSIQENEEPLVVTIILQRVYLDGEMSEEKTIETVWSMEDFWAKYDNWKLMDIEKSKAVFRQEIDDISPLLKANGYFGISDEGVLTIFNGRPGGSNIIQSFFQIDLGRLESIKRDQLEKGIPIKNKDCYKQVLETFKQIRYEPPNEEQENPCSYLCFDIFVHPFKNSMLK